MSITFLLAMSCALAILFGVLLSSSIRGLRKRFSEKYPDDWEKFKRSKPRHFLPGRGQQRWEWNPGAIRQYVEASAILSKDVVLRDALRRDQTIRVIAAVSFSVIFLSMLLAGH